MHFLQFFRSGILAGHVVFFARSQSETNMHLRSRDSESIKSGYRNEITRPTKWKIWSFARNYKNFLELFLGFLPLPRFSWNCITQNSKVLCLLLSLFFRFLLPRKIQVYSVSRFILVKNLIKNVSSSFLVGMGAVFLSLRLWFPTFGNFTFLKKRSGWRSPQLIFFPLDIPQVDLETVLP